jgi:hypothetical protein
MTAKSAVYRGYFIFSGQVLVVNHIANYRDTNDCHTLFLSGISNSTNLSLQDL